jgi:hypothetical protein
LRWGGSNSAFAIIYSKQDLQRLANELGIGVDWHYPPYTSKYNPIEHRFI